MSLLDIQELKRLAETASKRGGYWVYRFHPNDLIQPRVVRPRGLSEPCVIAAPACSNEDTKVDMLFIAAANPSNILELLKRLEQSDHHKLIVSLDAEVQQLNRKLRLAYAERDVALAQLEIKAAEARNAG